MSGRPWTPEEIAILEDMLGEHSDVTIAKRLGVKVSRVHNKVSTMGLSRKVEGIFSANELAGLLGMEANWAINFLLRGGHIPYRVVEGRGRWGQTQVLAKDVISFLKTNPHLIDRDKVDAAFQQYVPERWITTGEIFRRGGPHPVTFDAVYHAGYLPEARLRGQRIVVPESLLPDIVARRRVLTDDIEHRRQWRVYAAQQRRRAPIRRAAHQTKKSA